jgi:hypothetical protein
MMNQRACLIAVLTALLLPCAAWTQSNDTLRIEVGSKVLNGRVFKPHAARVKVYVGDQLTNEWTNELTLGDSAGRPIMRWVTKTVYSPTGVTNELLQTYDLETLQPYAFNSTSSNGAFTRYTISGRELRGTRRMPNDTTTQEIRRTLDRLGFMVNASDIVPVAAGLKAGAVMTAPVWGLNMPAAETRIFAVVRDTVVNVEGTMVRSWKVEERRQSDRALIANWYLLDKSPYMVYGEVPLPNGQVRRMTEVEVPMTRR